MLDAMNFRFRPRIFPARFFPAFLACAAAMAAYCPAETLLLRGGAKVSGPLLKSDSEVVVVDLGYQALSVPALQILDIQQDDSAAAAEAEASDSGLYAAADLDDVSTADAAARFGPAVVIVSSPAGLGSGFFVNRKGYLVTNYHVIMKQKRLAVTRFVKEDGILRKAVYRDVKIIAVDPFHDLAVLRIESRPEDGEIVPLIFSPSAKTRPGEKIFVIGNPMGLERTVTEGIVSQAARNFEGKLYIQVDAAVNPGNSGGPLFNRRGQVIGVCNMGAVRLQGLNFAIPARHVTYLLDHLDDYAYDEANSESGFIYPEAPPRFGKSEDKDDETASGGH